MERGKAGRSGRVREGPGLRGSRTTVWSAVRRGGPGRSGRVRDAESITFRVAALDDYSQGAALRKQGCGDYSRFLAQRQQVELFLNPHATYTSGVLTSQAHLPQRRAEAPRRPVRASPKQNPLVAAVIVGAQAWVQAASPRLWQTTYTYAHKANVKPHRVMAE